MKLPPRRVILGIVAIGLAAITCATWFSYPYFSFEERVRRSMPALEQFATQVKSSNGTVLAHPPSRLGYFNVGKVESLPHGFLFESDYGGPFDRNAIAYSSEPPPAGDPSGHGDFFYTDRQELVRSSATMT